jgi:hypothetical protein
MTLIPDEPPKRSIDDYRILSRLLRAGVAYSDLAARLIREGVDPAEAERLTAREIAKDRSERAESG